MMHHLGRILQVVHEKQLPPEALTGTPGVWVVVRKGRERKVVVAGE